MIQGFEMEILKSRHHLLLIHEKHLAVKMYDANSINFKALTQFF